MSSESVIGSGSVVRGNVRGEGSLEILGRIEGDVSVTGDVLVGESGVVSGNINSAKISVLGAVQGDLRGSEAVLIERGGKVAGDLSAPRIGIASGALVRGNVRTEGEPALSAGRRPQGAANPRPAGFPAKPTAPKPEAKSAPSASQDVPAPIADFALKAIEKERDGERRPPSPIKPPAPVRPPAPVVPALGKGAKAKKRSRES